VLQHLIAPHNVRLLGLLDALELGECQERVHQVKVAVDLERIGRWHIIRLLEAPCRLLGAAAVAFDRMRCDWMRRRRARNLNVAGRFIVAPDAQSRIALLLVGNAVCKVARDGVARLHILNCPKHRERCRLIDIEEWTAAEIRRVTMHDARSDLIHDVYNTTHAHTYIHTYAHKTVISKVAASV
jgi:hypothetical protein